MAQPLDRQSRLYIDTYEVDLRLSQLGLSRGVVIDAVQQGDLQRRMASPDEPNGAAGYYMWARALRQLRQETRERHHWYRGLFKRIPVAFNPEGTVAVAVSSGDDRTGRPGDDPATKNIKGFATVLAVENNVVNEQLVLLDDGVDFWYVLIYATDDDGIWVEISRPDHIDDEGRPDRWAERILIGRVDPYEAQRVALLPAEPSEPIEIPVQRRKNAS